MERNECTKEMERQGIDKLEGTNPEQDTRKY